MLENETIIYTIWNYSFASKQIIFLILICALVGGCVMPAQHPNETSQITPAQQPSPDTAKIAQLSRDVSHLSRGLSSDNTSEAQYLNNSIILLEQIKQLAVTAEKQKNSNARKLFDYSALSLDLDTIILGIKRYIAADDNTPRRRREQTRTELKGQYINAEY